MMPASYSSTFSETGFENLYLHVFLSGKLTICRCRPGLCKNGTIFLCQFPLLISFMFTFARPVRVFFFFFFFSMEVWSQSLGLQQDPYLHFHLAMASYRPLGSERLEFHFHHYTCRHQVGKYLSKNNNNKNLD